VVVVSRSQIVGVVVVADFAATRECKIKNSHENTASDDNNDGFIIFHKVQTAVGIGFIEIKYRLEDIPTINLVLTIARGSTGRDGLELRYKK